MAESGHLLAPLSLTNRSTVCLYDVYSSHNVQQTLSSQKC